MTQDRPVIDKITYEYTDPMDVVVEVGTEVFYKISLTIDRNDLKRYTGTEDLDDYDIELYIKQTYEEDQLINDAITQGTEIERTSEIMTAYEE